MKKMIFAVLVLLLSDIVVAAQETSAADANKQQLIQHIQNWVSGREGVSAHQVHVAAMDRRLKVPSCDQPFIIEYPYASSKSTVQATCPELSWKVFVTVSVNQPQTVLVYSRDMDANQLLGPEDVKSVAIMTSDRGLLKNSDLLQRADGQYSLTTSVKAGQSVREVHLVETVTVYLLDKDILRGEPIHSTDFSPAKIAITASYPNQRFPEALLQHAKALRDLPKGSTLSRRDFGVRHSVLMTTSAISRGQKLNSINTAIDGFYGDLPSDAVLALTDIGSMEATRNLQANQVIRLSDLKPSPMFNKGDRVQLTISRGALKVTVDMLALEPGRMDQQVDLLNPESNETVRALVTGPGTARGL